MRLVHYSYSLKRIRTRGRWWGGFSEPYLRVWGRGMMHDNRICAHPPFTKYLLLRLSLQVQHQWRCEGSMGRMTYRSIRECKGPRSIDHGLWCIGARKRAHDFSQWLPSRSCCTLPWACEHRTKQTSDLGGRQMGPLFALTLEANK